MPNSSAKRLTLSLLMSYIHTYTRIYIYTYLLVKPETLTSCIQGVSRLYVMTAGGDFLGRCDEKIHINMCPIYMDLRLETLKAVSFYLLHNILTLNQCRKLSCGTAVCKHLASY
jgi:hypothetical protein